MSKYGVFLGSYFPTFGLNTERYGVSLRIQYLSVFSPNEGKYEPKKTPYLDTFHAVVVPMKHYKEQMGNKQLLESYIRKRSDTILSPRKYLQRHHSRHRGYAFSFKVQRLIFQFSKTFIFSLEHFLSDALAMRQLVSVTFFSVTVVKVLVKKNKKSGKSQGCS